LGSEAHFLFFTSQSIFVVGPWDKEGFPILAIFANLGVFGNFPLPLSSRPSTGGEATEGEWRDPDTAYATMPTQEIHPALRPWKRLQFRQC
jgi:hypothetical protein